MTQSTVPKTGERDQPASHDNVSSSARPGDVLLNDFGRQWGDTASDVLSAVARVGESGWYILGKEVESFEHDLAGVLRRRHAVGCASGLDAIEIALRSLRLAPGTKVLTTPLSAFATTLAIVRAGAVPVFVDVDEHGLVDLAACRCALREDASIRAMVPVHLYGHVVDLGELERLAADFDVCIVEDCAQSIGATFDGRPAGSVGALAATSFYPTKNLGALGDGGALTSDDDVLATRCRALRDYGQSGKYVHDELGLNSRLDEIHAAILDRAFLPRLARWTERRRSVAGTYIDQMDNPYVRVLPAPARSLSVWHLFPVRVSSTARESFIRHLQACGVRAAIHYPRLIPDQKALSAGTFEVRGGLACARELAASEVSLPIHPYLRDQEIARVIDAVNSWVGS